MNKEILKAFEKVLDHHSKQLLTIDEACEYINYKKSYVYKLTSKNEIPFIKPRGKFLDFMRSDLDELLAGVLTNIKNLFLKPTAGLKI